jgi:predicted nucleic acid-binding protein
MIAYPDTSFLYALYRLQAHSGAASAYMKNLREALHVSGLLLYEFHQSLRWQEFLRSRDKHKGFDRAKRLSISADLESDMEAGVLQVVLADWPDVFKIAERLSDSFTSAGGHRAFDILHVATALHFGAVEFLTFDRNQKALAKAEGLKVPL